MSTVSELTFAEAMALDPSEVEVHMLRSRGPQWERLSVGLMDELTLADALKCHFRRARPGKSRVQEMAERGVEPTPGKSYVETIATIAVRAVCEYMRTHVYCTRAPHRQPLDGGDVAKDIEREFLEPK